MPQTYTEQRSALGYQHVTWPGPIETGDAVPYAIPEGHSVTVSIHGKGALFASKDGERFEAALDTAGRQITHLGDGARHLAPGYVAVKPFPLDGKCELTVKEPGQV